MGFQCTGRIVLALLAFASWSADAWGAQLYAEQGEELWVAADSFKVGFDARGATVVPFLGSKVERNWPLALRLESVRTGESELAIEREVPFRREGDEVSYDRGPLTELYRVSRDSIELAFRFDEVPRGGDLVLRLALETELEHWSDEHGLVFAGPDGGLHVGAATVFDGNGRSAPVEMELAWDAWTLRVDAAFLAVAKAPLLVDPLITTYSIDGSPAADRFPELAYDASLGLQVVVWERTFSILDRDIHGQVLDASGVTLREFMLFGSPANETSPRIAGIEALDRFLVAVAAQPSRVTTRTLDLTGGGFVAGPPVTYTTEVFQYDLGGDSGTVPPYYWSLAYNNSSGPAFAENVTRAFVLDQDAAVLHDLLLGAAYDYAYDEPRISKRTIQPSSGARRWAFMHRSRDVYLGGGTMSGGWLLTTGGKLPAPGFSDSGSIVTFSVTAREPATIVGVYRDGASFLGKVGGAPPVVLAPALLADVDSDGASVLLSYVDLQWVVHVASFAIQGGTLVPTESAVAISAPGEDAATPNIVTTSGAGTFSERALCAWESQTTPNGTFDIAGAVYDTPGPGLRYCPAAPNSVGPGATIHASGSISIELDLFTLSAQGCPPNRPGIFYLGQDQIHIPFGEGYRCIGGATRRITPTLTTDASGSVSLLLDFDQPYGDLVLPGAPGINYQFWYVGSSRVDLQACKLEYSIVSPK